MGKSRTFNVLGNRIQFKCSECRTRRNVSVLPNVRRKKIRCHSCGEIFNCLLNRRLRYRELQSGKATIMTKEGLEFAVDLHDISQDGVGFNATFQAIRIISRQQVIKISCSWNPRLFNQGRYVVKNINGRRIGVQHVTQKNNTL